MNTPRTDGMERGLLGLSGMGRLVPLALCALSVCALLGCSDSHGGDDEGDAAVADASSDAASSDLGVLDAGSVACADVAEGEPCAPEGSYCETECDPCSFCNVLTCTDGKWVRLEAFPPPPETCFDCGPGGLRCLRGTAYCAHDVSDVGGVPDGYRCNDVPMDCSPVTCACFEGPAFGGTTCSDEGMNAVTVTFPGG